MHVYGITSRNMPFALWISKGKGNQIFTFNYFLVLAVIDCGIVTAKYVYKDTAVTHWIKK